jgi:hypothetical protein
MPIEIGIWRLNGSEPTPVHFSSIETERRLEAVLERDISVLDPTLMLIGRQITTPHGARIDLLAVDSQGDLVVVEIKRHRTPRDVVAQALDYASWVESLTYSDITGLYNERHPGKQFEQAFFDHFQADPPEALNENHRLVVVASELDPSTERIISYLSNSYGVPINAVFFRYFQEAGNEYLARTWLINPNEAEAQRSRSAPKKEPWNGLDFYVSIGEGVHRSWEDFRQYGFVSAGQGRWYSKSLEALFPGARIFACIPGTGYVGVGTVTEPAVPVREFMVEVNGQKRPLLEAPLKAPQMANNADDPEKSEYVVRVDWENTCSADDAIWEKGMFANQNSACRLRNKFTLEKLVDAFGLEQ